MSVAERRRAKEEATIRALGTVMVPPDFFDDDGAPKAAQRKVQKRPVAVQGIGSERPVEITYAALVTMACATAGVHKYFSTNLDLVLAAGAVIGVTLGTWFAAKGETDRAGRVVQISFFSGFVAMWVSFSLGFALLAGALLGGRLVGLDQAISRSVRITNTPAVLVRSRFRRRVIWDLLPLTSKAFREKLAAQTGKRNHLLQLTRDGNQLVILCSPQQQYVVYFTAAPIYDRGEESWHRLIIPSSAAGAGSAGNAAGVQDAENPDLVEFHAGKHKLQYPKRAVVSRLDVTLAAEAFIATGNPLPRFTWESGREVTRQLPPREIPI